jgi:hypothetical protein
MRVAMFIAVTALMSALPANAVSAPTGSAELKRQVASLKKQVRAKERSRRHWIAEAEQLADDLTAAEDEASDLRGRLDYALAATAQIPRLTGERDVAIAERNAARAERDAARADLPTAIKSVPLNEFVALVLSPARAAWPCDSYYQSGSYWSYTFDSPRFC